MKAWKDRKKYYFDEKPNTNKKKKYFFSKTMKHQTMVMMASVAFVFMVMFGTSYAILSSVNKSADFNGVKVGNLYIDYQDESGAISLSDSYPLSDSEGLNSEAYSFSIKNTGSLASTYSVKLLDDVALINGEEKTDEQMSQKLLSKSNLKVSVNGETPVILESLSIKNYEILAGTLQPGETKKISVRLWIKSDAGNDIFFKDGNGALVGKYYFGKITVEGENTKTYETDHLVRWLDAINNSNDGHSNAADTWYDLSENSHDFSLNSINGVWNSNSYNIKNGNAGLLNFNYDVSSFDEYTISAAVMVHENSNQIFNIIDDGEVSIALKNGGYVIGNNVELNALENNKLHVVTLIVRNKRKMNADSTYTTEKVKELYVDGNFVTNITNVGRLSNNSTSFDMDIFNYLVYDKALTINEENNNYQLTLERYGD